MRHKAKSEVFLMLWKFIASPKNVDYGWNKVRDSGDNNISCYNVLQFGLQGWKIFNICLW